MGKKVYSQEMRRSANREPGRSSINDVSMIDRCWHSSYSIILRESNFHILNQTRYNSTPWSIDDPLGEERRIWKRIGRKIGRRTETRFWGRVGRRIRWRVWQIIIIFKSCSLIQLEYCAQILQTLTQFNLFHNFQLTLPPNFTRFSNRFSVHFGAL